MSTVLEIVRSNFVVRTAHCVARRNRMNKNSQKNKIKINNKINKIAVILLISIKSVSNYIFLKNKNKYLVCTHIFANFFHIYDTKTISLQ